MNIWPHHIVENPSFYPLCEASVDDRLEDEGVVAVAVEMLPAPGVQLQVMVDGLLDVLDDGIPSRHRAFDDVAQGFTRSPVPGPNSHSIDDAGVEGDKAVNVG